MYYSTPFLFLPKIIKYYEITRHTIWKITEKEDLILFVTAGECLVSLDNEEYHLETDDLFFIPANHPYKRFPVDNKEYTIRYIHFNLSQEFQKEDSKTIQSKIRQEIENQNSSVLSGKDSTPVFSGLYLMNLCRIKDTAFIKENFKTIRSSFIKRPTTFAMQASSALYSVLIKMEQCTVDSFITGQNEVPRKPDMSPTLQKAIQYIFQNYTKKISLDELAQYCFITKQQLIRYFKNSFKTTPVSYINNYRVNKAKELLMYSPELSVKEISELLGFNSAQYFSRIFSKSTKETPVEYRNRVLNTTNWGDKTN